MLARARVSLETYSEVMTGRFLISTLMFDDQRRSQGRQSARSGLIWATLGSVSGNVFDGKEKTGRSVPSWFWVV